MTQGILDRRHLGMVATAPAMPAAANYFALPHDNGAHGRIRTRVPGGLPGLGERRRQKNRVLRHVFPPYGVSASTSDDFFPRRLLA